MLRADQAIERPPTLPGDQVLEAAQLSVSISRIAEVGDVAGQWSDLELRSDATFFLSWDWIGCWLRQSGASPYLLTVRHGGVVVGLALLQPVRQRRHRLLHANALTLHQVGRADMDIITIEHNGLLADRRYTAVATEACVDFLVRHRRGTGWDWNELHMGGTPAPEGLRPLADKAGLLMWYYAYKQSWVVDLQAIRQSGGSYLASLSANTRYQIRRAARLYEKRGPLTATPARDVAEAMRFFEPMKALHQRYWISRGHPGSYAYPFFERFHRALIAECLPKGTVELLCIAAGGVPIGYVYNFVSNGRVCAYHTAFEYDEDPKLKPGLVSHHLCIERHLQGTAAVYDFLAGGERYKASLAQPGPDMAHLVLQRPLLRFRAEHAARRLKGRLGDWLHSIRKPAAPGDSIGKAATHD